MGSLLPNYLQGPYLCCDNKALEGIERPPANDSVPIDLSPENLEDPLPTKVQLVSHPGMGGLPGQPGTTYMHMTFTPVHKNGESHLKNNIVLLPLHYCSGLCLVHDNCSAIYCSSYSCILCFFENLLENLLENNLEKQLEQPHEAVKLFKHEARK